MGCWTSSSPMDETEEQAAADHSPWQSASTVDDWPARKLVLVLVLVLARPSWRGVSCSLPR
jgi:hypothetical protein